MLKTTAICLFVVATSGIPMTAVAQTTDETSKCGYCLECEENGQDGHKFTVDPHGDYSGVTHVCFGGVSCLAHYACGSLANASDGEQAEFRQLIVWTSEGDMSSASRLIRTYPDKVRINWHRHALQVFSCDGNTVLAHLPLQDSQLLLLGAGAAAATRLATSR